MRTWGTSLEPRMAYLIATNIRFESAKNVEFWITLCIPINLMLDRIKNGYDVFEIFSLLTIIAMKYLCM